MRYMPQFLIPNPRELRALENLYHPRNLPTYQRWQAERLTPSQEVKLADYTTQAAMWGRTDLTSFRSNYTNGFTPDEVKITKPMRDQWSNGDSSHVNYNVVRAFTANPFAPLITRIFFETGCLPDLKGKDMSPLYYRYDQHPHRPLRSNATASKQAYILLQQAGFSAQVINQKAVLSFNTLEDMPTMKVERPEGWLISDAYANWRQGRKRDQDTQFNSPDLEHQKRLFSEPHFVVTMRYKGSVYKQELPWGQIPLVKEFEWDAIDGGDSPAHHFWNYVVSHLHEFVAPLSMCEFFALYIHNRPKEAPSIYKVTASATRLPHIGRAMPRDFNTAISKPSAQQRQIVDKHFIPETMLTDPHIQMLLATQQAEPVDYIKGKTVGKIVENFHD